MQELLDIVLLFTALAGMTVSVLVLVVLVLAVHLLKSLQPHAQTHFITSTGSTTGSGNLNWTFTPVAAHAPASAPTPIPPAPKSFKCEHCGAQVVGEPVRAVIEEGATFLVYVCSNCKQETATLENG